MGYTHFDGVDAANLKINGTEVTATAAEINATDGSVAGTVVASKAVVVDANKDIATFRNVTVTNLDAGASGTAGTVDVFPATASKGKLAITCANQTGNTTVTVNAAAMGQATTVNIGDPGIAASYFVQAAAHLKIAQMPVQADSVAADVAGIVADFNTLLGKLKTAGMMASS